MTVVSLGIKTLSWAALQVGDTRNKMFHVHWWEYQWWTGPVYRLQFRHSHYLVGHRFSLISESAYTEKEAGSQGSAAYLDPFSLADIWRVSDVHYWLNTT